MTKLKPKAADDSHRENANKSKSRRDKIPLLKISDVAQKKLETIRTDRIKGLWNTIQIRRPMKQLYATAYPASTSSRTSHLQRRLWPVARKTTLGMSKLKPEKTSANRRKTT